MKKIYVASILQTFGMFEKSKNKTIPIPCLKENMQSMYFKNLEDVVFKHSFANYGLQTLRHDTNMSGITDCLSVEITVWWSKVQLYCDICLSNSY